MRVLVFQHVAIEHPGVFRELWEAAGDVWVPVELDAGERIPAFDRFDLLVVMGGPMDVWHEDQHPWLRLEKEAIRRWVVELGRPFLGICLGHQLLAEALGGTVSPMIHPEVGFSDVELTPRGEKDALFEGCPRRFEAFHWHGAEVTGLPDDTDILCGNAACRVQAFRYGPHAYGVQYHCEITQSTVSDWAAIPAYAASLEQALGPEATRLASTVGPRLPAFRQAAQRLDGNLRHIVSRSGAPDRRSPVDRGAFRIDHSS